MVVQQSILQTRSSATHLRRETDEWWLSVRQINVARAGNVTWRGNVKRMSLGVYIIWNSRVIVQFLIHSFTYNTRSLHSRIATITHWLELNDWQPANNSCKETRVGFRTEDFERHTRLIIGTLKITLLHPPLMNSKQCQQSLEWKGWGCLIYDTNRENSNL